MKVKQAPRKLPVADKATELTGALPRASVQQQVYEAIRDRILRGAVLPGAPVSLRRLAQELGVSPMPVRSALNRLIAERALTMRNNRRIYVAAMDRDRYHEIRIARLLLEPQAARLAFPSYQPELAGILAAIDDDIDLALKQGDVDGYIAGNRRFHFALYGPASHVLVPLIESLWLQFSPFMRIVYGRIGTTTLTDYHREAVKAVAAGNVDMLCTAIAADIAQGMDHLGAVMGLSHAQDAAVNDIDKAEL